MRLSCTKRAAFQSLLQKLRLASSRLRDSEMSVPGAAMAARE